MPRCSSTESPPARRIRMYLPRRRKPVTRAPVRRLCRPSGSGQRRSGRCAMARTMTRPSSRSRRPRITVSTSGSSGMGAGHAIGAANERQPRRDRDRRFRLPPCPASGEAGHGARRVRQRRAALRPDERPDVARRSPRVEERAGDGARSRPAADAAGSRGRHRRHRPCLARAGRRAGAAERRQRRRCWMWRAIVRCRAG